MNEITENMILVTTDKWHELTELSKEVTENLKDDFLEILALSATLD